MAVFRPQCNLLFLSEIPTLHLSLCDNECWSSPSYVFSSAWGPVSAHGPLIINLALRWPFDHSSILYLYDSDLTSSSGLGYASPPPHTFFCFLLGLLSGTSRVKGRGKHRAKNLTDLAYCGSNQRVSERSKRPIKNQTAGIGSRRQQRVNFTQNKADLCIVVLCSLLFPVTCS